MMDGSLNGLIKALGEGRKEERETSWLTTFLEFWSH